jgi:predicted NUDIX family phosphoesterase
VSQERVYGLPGKRLPEPRAEVLPLPPELFAKLAREGEVRSRAEAEEDESWRQLIPYGVVEQRGSLLLVERLAAGSESRLHHKLSIGLGGHIDPQDLEASRNPIEAALTRELREELHIGAFFAEAVGLIHRHETPVERVHTGILYRVRSPGPVRVRERAKLRGRFASVESLYAEFERLEGWSQTALRFLFPGRKPS